MALATDKVTNEPVGSVYSADNVSGATEEIRRYKVQTRIKHYRWIRELVVDPDYQGLGVGQVLAYMALNTGLLAQRATVYAFPLEIPKLDAVIKKIGGTPTGPTVPKDGYFGKDSEPVMQQRYEISTARSAARRLSKTPAVKQSLASINMHR